MTPFTFTVHSDGVCVLKLEQQGKPVVVLDAELIRRLDATLDVLPKNIIGLVLASASERVFVAGADLNAIQAMADDELHRYLTYASSVYGKLSQLPYPTAAAINGAALGGGLELAMHCDALVAAPGVKPYPVGLPEAGLGICPGWGGTCLLPARIDAADAIRRTAAGKPLMFDEAVAAGLFDMVAADQASLLGTARMWVLTKAREGKLVRDGAPSRHAGRTKWAAETVKALDAVRGEISGTPAGQSVAMCVDAGVTKGWKACLEVEQRELVKLRHTPQAKAAIEAFFAKSKK
ncbi:MAG: enoyl-CoA hydratase-related protein [Phycisphaerales bacterium]